MKVEKVTGYIGAEIVDLNLADEITLDIAQALREALSQHQVIFLRSQYLNLEQQRELTKVFGPLMQCPARISGRVVLRYSEFEKGR